MKSTDLLLGRKIFEIFDSYWPEHANFWPGINDVTKYVMSKCLVLGDILILTGQIRNNKVARILTLSKVNIQRAKRIQNTLLT